MAINVTDTKVSLKKEEMERSMRPKDGTDLSMATKKYLRAAKTSGNRVLVAIDATEAYKNMEQVSNYVDLVMITKYGSRQLAQVFLSAYIACATKYAKSITEVIDEDMSTAMDFCYMNLSMNSAMAKKRREEIESVQEKIRDLNRIAVNKPKE